MLKILSALGLLLLAALAVALYAYRDRSTETLLAKYGTEASRFVEIDGVRIHYRDEGDGPPIVLMHAHFASLVMWEDWARALKDHYRIVRLDMTSHGLTGVDPSGDYTVGRTVELLGKFVDRLGLERFTLGGTSLGGTIAIRYTAAHPERIERLILISPGALEGRAMKPGRDRVPAWADVLAWVTPRALAEFMLESGFGDKSKLSPAIVDEWHDMWLHEGNRMAELTRIRQYKAGDIEAQIAAVRVPVLLMWGEKNPQAPLEQAEEFVRLLSEAPSVELRVLSGVGHMAVQEAPDETIAIAREWLERGAAEGTSARASDVRTSAGASPEMRALLPRIPGS